MPDNDEPEGEPPPPDATAHADDDHRLVARAMAGHRGSFDDLVRATAKLVWSQLALQGIRDPSTIDDLVQETFLRAWRHIRTLQSPARFRPWLIAIAHRVRVDELRRQGSRKRGGLQLATTDEIDAAGDSRESSAPSPDAQATVNEEKQRALSAMRALPEQYRDALALRYLGGCDVPEITRQLALTDGQVRGLLHRGLELLRQQLNPHPRPATVAAAAASPGGAA